MHYRTHLCFKTYKNFKTKNTKINDEILHSPKGRTDKWPQAGLRFRTNHYALIRLVFIDKNMVHW